MTFGSFAAVLFGVGGGPVSEASICLMDPPLPFLSVVNVFRDNKKSLVLYNIV